MSKDEVAPGTPGDEDLAADVAAIALDDIAAFTEKVEAHDDVQADGGAEVGE